MAKVILMFYGEIFRSIQHPENTNFGIFVPRNLKFHTFDDLHKTKKC